jgi:hypothetical protein
MENVALLGLGGRVEVGSTVLVTAVEFGYVAGIALGI